MMKEERFLYMLTQALQLLASDYNDQVGSLPQFVNVPDELTMTYRDCVLLLDQILGANLVSEEQGKRIAELDQLLQQMDADKSLFTVDAVMNRSEWQSVRQAAREVLQLLGIPRQKPDLSWLGYARGAQAT